MSDSERIKVAWATLGVLLVAGGVWTFTNMGDCPFGETCIRAWWLDPGILVVAIAVWLLGIRRILRKKA